MIHFVLHPLLLVLYFYLTISALYILILAIAGITAKDMLFELESKKKKIIVLIPAYKEDFIIVETAKKSASHNYPSACFRVMVIADSLQTTTIKQLRNIPVQLLEVKFDNSTKAKSLHAALSEAKNDNFDIALVLDADNVMGDGCLEQINSAFHNGHSAIQCHRSAKNTHTHIALLDAVSEEININLFRRGPAALGLSAMPLGSGMALDFNLLRDIFEAPGILDNTAEDREIEIQLMKRKQRMEFLNRVFVYDEKVSGAGDFQKQRTRWLEAQLNHIRRFFKPDLINIPKTKTYCHIFFQSLLLPRLLYLLICCLVLFVLGLDWWFDWSIIYPVSGYWICWMIAYILALSMSIPSKYYSFKTLRAITRIPLLMFSMLKAISKLKRNRREFLHTSKTYHDK